MIHIGEKIKEVFEKQPKGHNIEWFAGQLHCKRSNIYNIFNRSTIDTDLLFHISRVLGHDFFRDLTSELSCNEDSDESKSEIYNELMQGIGQLLHRQLNRLSNSTIPLRYILNANEGEDSPLPSDSYTVSVLSGEKGKDPFITLYSTKDHFELTYPLHGDCHIKEIRNQGRACGIETFQNITERIREWLDMPRPDFGNRIDNRLYSLIAFNTLNS